MSTSGMPNDPGSQNVRSMSQTAGQLNTSGRKICPSFIHSKTMAASTFDSFGTSIGLSGSHTAQPMRAARLFALALRDDSLLDRTVCVKCELYGSLAATGRSHGSDKAVLLGLEGEEAD